MNNTLSDRLKEVRQNAKLNQKAFANIINTNQSTLSAYENGDRTPPIETLIMISKAFNVSLDWLCGLNDNIYPEGELSTYKQLFHLIIQILSAHYPVSNEPICKYSVNYPEDYKLCELNMTFSHDIKITTFFKDWDKIHNLYLDNTIDKDLYTIWLEKKLIEADIYFDSELPFF